MSKEHTRVVHGRESVSVFPVCNTCEIHPTQIEKQLLDHEGLNGEMWCYQKPGFEALLIAELQKQQQCSQFCDTLLKTEGISVPAHSCILSAISPHISSALSSAPPPPAGQSRLLEFRALGACTLLHMVRLLYCGEMAGEGENEKQEAISAAAKLGIHGLVEVTKRDRKSRKEEGEGCHTEVGVQTEPLMPEENDGRLSRWRREVNDGSTFLWKETLSDGEKETWTQTEEQHVNTGPPSHPAASFETIDMAALQSFGMTDSHLVPPEIPCIPISLVYPPDENQTHQPLSAFVDSMQESTAAEHTSVPVVAVPHAFVPPPLLPFTSQATSCGAASQSWWGASRNVAAAEEWEDEQLEQFQGNIPGYISYFLKPDKEEGSCRGRARSRRGAGVGGARRAGTGERRARRPRARTAGRGRGGLTQTVDVQEVGVSRLQKLFLQRWGLRASMTGQGGGAAGRKLYLKTRELLKPAKGRRGHGKVWEFSQSGDVPPYSEGGGNTQRGRRSTTQQFNQDGLPVGRVRRARAKPTTSVSFSSPHFTCSNAPTLSAFSPALQPSPSPGLQSAASSSLLHSTSLPPPPHEDHPEHFDRLLEEVMMGLDILPNNHDGAPRSQPPLPTRGSRYAYGSCGNTLAQNKQQGCATGLLEANTGFHGSTHVVAVARGAGSSSSAVSEMPVLQQQGEGELNKMLDHFLQSFEQHVDSFTARDEVEMCGQSCTEASQPHTVLRKHRKSKTPHTPHLQNTHTLHPARHSQITELQQSDESETLRRCSQPRKASACSAAPPKHTEGSPGKVSAPAERRKRVRKPVSSSDAKTKSIHDRGDKQLMQMPVVKLERSGPLPAQVTLQKPSCPEVQKPAKTKTGASSRKYPRDRLSKMVQPFSWSTKMYPIRSRFREAHIMDSLPFLEEPPSAGLPRPRRGRPKKNGQILSFSNGESSAPPIQPQPVEPCCVDEQLERNQERHEEELTVQPQKEAEAPTSRGEKRGAESERETSDVVTVAKRVCFERMAQLTSETCPPSSESSDFVSEPAIRELRDISSVGDCLQREREEEPVQREIKLRETVGSLMDEEMQSSDDEIIDVDGPTLSPFVKVRPSVSPSSHSAKELSLGSTGSWEEDDDEDIDVIGGASPAPDPVIISWTESSEEEVDEDEDVDVVGEKTDYASSAVLSTMSTE
ncbi:uncharacterized protein LOC116052423 isoform X2 [Sander lucioperca]|uniref:uncharacterized protein LOC116052423 isoform X2 n=1 Tax=Sander lucioperca TaxID=283035 RepID=UPI00125D3865|nr:uncharacterized protein LOC116052423 isoform X2 [Sander lucioperca]